MRIISIVLICVVCPSTITGEAIASYTDILTKHCSPPFHFYKSWCYYLFPNLTLDWSSAYRLCRSIDKHTSLVYVTGDDEMLDPLRDILIHREKSVNIQSVWTNTTWGQQRRTLLSRQSKRMCRKIEVKSTLKSGQIDRLRMPFANCREKHPVMCRKELPSNLICRRPWALAYGICYYLDEQARITSSEEEERNILQCQAWQGELFSSSKEERTVLSPFLSYSLHGLRSKSILSENFGGISYSFDDVVQDRCALVSGDVYLSTAMADLRKFNRTDRCSAFNSYTFCRQRHNSSCEPPWFADDGFCLYYSPRLSVDMAGASIECARHGGHLLYINNEEELFRLTHNLLVFTPFFPSRALAGVWLALSHKATTSFNENESETDFQWQWDLSIQSYLDERWKSTDWKRFFQHRLAPDIVSAGDCTILIVDSQIREPIERTSCHHQRTVVCRKPFEQEERSFHKKSHYERFSRLRNITETAEPPVRKPSPTNATSLMIQRSLLELLNSTTYRWIVYINGSSSVPTPVVLTCQSKGILEERVLPSETSSSVMAFDIPLNTSASEYQLFFKHLRSSNCTNTTAQPCLYVSCVSTDAWMYRLPEIINRLQGRLSMNQACLTKHRNSPNDSRICSLLTDQFRLSEKRIALSPTLTTNECQAFGGQCIPEALIVSKSMQLMDESLTCSKGFICWLQGRYCSFLCSALETIAYLSGERCADHAFCIDRVRFPCPISSQLANVTCSNTHHHCCASSITPNTSSIILPQSMEPPLTWNLFLPVYYFSFHGTSKWDRFFFDSWLRMDSDLSQDFVNDEFLFSCTGIFIESNVFLTHQSCLPTRLNTFDKRSILFSMVKKSNFDQTDVDQYDRVALQIETYQIYSPFQLVRLAYRHDFLGNKTFTRLNDEKLLDEQANDLHCVLALSENQIRPVRLVNNFERQFLPFDSQRALFAFQHRHEDNDGDDDELSWSFAPIICVRDKQDHHWMIVAISGQQLNHQCQIFNQKRYCQMNLIYSSTWNWE